MLPALNKQGAFQKRALVEGREEELYRKGNIDARYMQWLKDMAERDAESMRKRTEQGKVQQELTLGYVTKDVSRH